MKYGRQGNVGCLELVVFMSPGMTLDIASGGTTEGSEFDSR
jgi:hypothetical protein